MKVVDTEKLHIKLWLDDIEDGALKQAKNMANLPFAFHHIAIMPDSHQGYGMPIGGVLATKYVIIPNAVGVDIGCGMCAIKTSLVDINTKVIKKIFGGSKENQSGIRSCVPVGFNHHSKKQDESLMPLPKTENGMYVFSKDNPVLGYVSRKEYESSLKQLGTLGGGNHFIEIQKGSDGHIWIMIHSGSRNLGKQVADHYNKLAVTLNEKWFSSVPKKHELAFLPIDTPEAKDYMTEMNYCVEFALANRKLMMDKVMKIFCEQTSCSFEPMINIAHNYARWENHFGCNVMVHRKGATSARKGEIGIIPGSQGSKSYIVRGLGNKDSFESCSHGAGRKMSRTKAIKTFNLQEEIDKMDNAGIIHSIRTVKDLDECVSAYKDIEIVMENQKDLVEIVTELTPLAVIKG